MPEGTHTWELSWKRVPGIMRLRLTQCPHDDCQGDAREWLFKELNGHWSGLHGDKASGRFLFEARAQIEHNNGQPHLYLWEPT